ncbi:MAG TPA: dienelactone hydrolase family protein [Polyangiales bacterium]|nr:dienelactone hydrolase family protein [Polyangiales bacterium]
MTEETIEVRTPDGIADGFLNRPAAGSPAPGVIMLTDIGGIREVTKQLAQRVADQGFVVLSPNVFYRTGRSPLWSFRPNFGDERTAKRFAELAGPLQQPAVERDAQAYADFLAAQPGVRQGPLAVVGYCFTGGVALRMAAAQPERFAAVASFHGGGLCTDAPTSPHLVLPRVRARLYFGHASQDRSMSQESIDKLGTALAAWGGKHESELYEGAFHGWTMADSPVWNEPQAERAFGKLIELLKQTLA